jgi:hypothetical protein
VAVAATKPGWNRLQIRGGFEWANFYAGFRVPGRTPYCVVVVLNPPGGLHNGRVIAYAYYRSPVIDPVLVAAVRTKFPCTPANRPRTG